MGDYCVICTEELPEARAILKCGHSFCSECIFNNIALNIGTEEGTSRTKCPMCRETYCAEVSPSANIISRISDLKDDIYNLTEALKFSDTQNVFYKKDNEKLKAKIEEVYERMEYFKEESEVQNFIASKRKNTITKLKEGIKKLDKMVVSYNDANEYLIPDTLQFMIQSLMYPNSGSLVTDESTEIAETSIFNIDSHIMGVGNEINVPFEEVTGFSTIEGNYSVESISEISPPDENPDFTDELTLHSPAKEFMHLERILNTAIHGGQESSILREDQWFLPANETVILKTIVDRLNTIDKDIGINLREWCIEKGNSVDDILTINPCGGDYLILRGDILDKIIGVKIGEILRKFGLVKKYRGENVSSQRVRLKKILDLRDDPRRTLIGSWIDEKIPELINMSFIL